MSLPDCSTPVDTVILLLLILGNHEVVSARQIELKLVLEHKVTKRQDS